MKPSGLRAMNRYPFGQRSGESQLKRSRRGARRADQTYAAPRDNTSPPHPLSAGANREPVFSGLLDQKLSRAVDMSRACPPYMVIGFAPRKVARAESARKASTPSSDKKCRDEAGTGSHILSSSVTNGPRLTNFDLTWIRLTRNGSFSIQDSAAHSKRIQNGPK